MQIRGLQTRRGQSDALTTWFHRPGKHKQHSISTEPTRTEICVIAEGMPRDSQFEGKGYAVKVTPCAHAIDTNATSYNPSQLARGC